MWRCSHAVIGEITPPLRTLFIPFIPCVLQEVLRRYILLTRAGVAVKEGQLDAPLHEMTDDVAVVQV